MNASVNRHSRKSPPQRIRPLADRNPAFICVLIILFLPLRLLATGSDSALQALFSGDEEETLVERLPFDVEPVSLGLFKLTDEEMDSFERPAAIGTYLASFSGVVSFHSNRVLEGNAISASSNTVRAVENGLLIDLLSDDDKALLSACEVVARYPGKPVTIDVFAGNIKEGQERETKIVRFMADVLARHPDEIETILQVDPDEKSAAWIRVLGVEK